MVWRRIFAFNAMTLALMACDGYRPAAAGGSSANAAEPPPETGTDIPTLPEEPSAARWEAAASGSRAWTLYLYGAMDEHGADLLTGAPADVNEYCPNFFRLTRGGKKDFWIYLLSSIAQFESGFRPELSYTEDFTDSNGQLVVSRGLLQLSIESARAYGCVLPSAQDLHDPLKNLQCGMRILNRWVGRDGVIRAQEGGAWRGGARYWSVLRRDQQYQSIKAWTSAQSYCLSSQRDR